MTGVSDAGGANLPAEVWQRLAQAVAHVSIADLNTFSNVCRASRIAVDQINEERHNRVRAQFQTSSFQVDQGMIERTVLVHLVPQKPDSLIIIAEVCAGMGENRHAGHAEGPAADSDGFEISWIREGSIITKQLLVPGLYYPASSVSNVKFAPDGSHIAMLLTIDSGAASLGTRDPIQRLSGLNQSDQNSTDLDEKLFEPSDECVLVVAKLDETDSGEPFAVHLTAFPHAFVPEYGFDMLWRRKDATSALELAFAGILHSNENAALFLACWSGWSEEQTDVFKFVARLPGAAKELIEDKEDAMRACTSTRVTSRIELSNDLTKIFFDTFSKFGVFEVSHNGPGTECVVVRKSVDVPTRAPIGNPFKDTNKPPGRTRYLPRIKTWSKRSARSHSQMNLTPAASQAGCMYSPMNEIRRSPPDGSVAPERHHRSFRDYLPWRDWFSFAEAEKLDTPPSFTCEGVTKARASESDDGSGRTLPKTAIHIATAIRSVFKRQPVVIVDDSDTPSIPWDSLGRTSVAVSLRSSNRADGEECVDEETPQIVDGIDGPQSRPRRPPSTASMCEIFRTSSDLRTGSEEGVERNSTILRLDMVFSPGHKDFCSTPSSSSKSFSGTKEDGETGTKEGADSSNSDARNSSLPTWSSSRTGTSSNLIMHIGQPGNLRDVTSVPSKCRRIAFSKSALISSSPRISAMSPNGEFICSVYISKLAGSPGKAPAHLKCVEVRKTQDGSLVFRNCSAQDTAVPDCETSSRMRFEKAHEIVANTCGFSDDSSILWVRDVWISEHYCIFSRRLPTVFRASDGAVLRTFSENLNSFKHIQLGLNGLTLYGTRFCRSCPLTNRGTIYVDAYDVVTGDMLSTKEMAGPLKCPDDFNSQAVYLTSPSTVRAVSRGDVDALWESTRGSVGCRWATHHQHEDF